MRVGALVFEGDDVALVRRVNPEGLEFFVLPGGNVEAAEPVDQALGRELQEELGLDLGKLGVKPELTWLLDAMLSRPGRIPPRKLHLIYRVYVDGGVRRGLRTWEHDDGLGSAPVVWMDYRRTADLRIFPPVPVSALVRPDVPVDAASVWLGTVGDEDYQWV